MNFTSPAGRASWPFVFVPRESQDGKTDPKYGIDVLLKKGDPEVEEFVKTLKAHVMELVQNEWPDKAKRPAKLRGALKDGDTWVVEQGENEGKLKKDLDENLAGHYVLKATRSQKKSKPGVVDVNCADVIDASALQPGYWVRVSVRPYVYNNKTCGWSLNLDHVQIMKKDTVFGGGTVSAADAFGKAKGAAAPTAQDMDDLL